MIAEEHAARPTIAVTSGDGAVCLTIADDPRGGSLTRAVSPDVAVRLAAELLHVAGQVTGRDVWRAFRRHPAALTKSKAAEPRRGRTG